MRRQRTRLTLALLCAGVAGALGAPGAGAQGTALGNVCAMLSPAQVAALHAPKTCTPKSLKSASNETAYGFWQGNGSARLAVTVVSWTNAKQLAVAAKTLKSLPGTVQTVKGVGSVAYESSLGSSMAMNFVKGHTIVNIQLQSLKPIASTAPFNAAAKAIAAKV